MIVITTPTGAIGSQVLDAVLDADRPARVIVRDPTKLPPRVRERVEIVPGSHGDRGAVERAFAGADTVFWLVAADRRAASPYAAFVDFTRPASEAIPAYGVSRVVAISALGRGVPGDAGYVTATLAADDLIAATGVRFRALVMPSFMDNLLRQVASIRDRGVFFDAIRGDLKAPTCARRDIAAAAARLLLDDTWTGQASQAVLGPEDLSPHEMAQTMTEVLGRPVRYERVPVEAYRSQLVAGGFSPAMAQGMVDMAVAKDNGLDNAEPRTPESSTPTSFRQWCEEVLRPAVLG
jgi:uncharacterized protein YbjT (DUF2867 family)